LLARIDETLRLARPICGTEMRIIAFIIDARAVRHFLARDGEFAEPCGWLTFLIIAPPTWLLTALAPRPGA